MAAPAAGKSAGKGPPAVPVSIATVMQESIPIRLQAIGNVEAYQTVALKARVDELTSDYRLGDAAR